MNGLLRARGAVRRWDPHPADAADRPARLTPQKPKAGRRARRARPARAPAAGAARLRAAPRYPPEELCGWVVGAPSTTSEL